MKETDFLVIGSSESETERECIAQWNCVVLEPQEFPSQYKEGNCRVLLLVEPDPSLLEEVQEYWADTTPPLTLIANSEGTADDDSVLCFRREELVKPTFRSLVKGLLRSKKERDAHQVLARVSHDMRSPISVIKMACQLTGVHGENTKQRQRYLSMIEDSTVEIQSLIGDILDFSKLDADTVTLNESTFNLHSVFNNVVESTRLLAEQKGLTMRANLHPATPEVVRGDPGRLKQILTNLTNNAVKFTATGFVEVNTVPYPGGCGFEVVDSGIGIPPGAQEKVFQAYQQADETILNKFGGTGLGLSICQMLVKKMGGEIMVWSTPGEGSCFSFSVKLAHVIEEQSPVQEISLKGMKIWTIEHPTEEAWHRSAAEGGFEFEAFQKTYSLARKAQGETPDAFLFNLDNGGFIRLSRVLNQFPEDKQPKVVVTTSAGQRGDAARCRELGVNGYLSMPFEFSDLDILVRLVIQEDTHDLMTRHTIKERGLSKVKDIAC